MQLLEFQRFLILRQEITRLTVVLHCILVQWTDLQERSWLGKICLVECETACEMFIFLRLYNTVLEEGHILSTAYCGSGTGYETQISRQRKAISKNPVHGLK